MPSKVVPSCRLAFDTSASAARKGATSAFGPSDSKRRTARRKVRLVERRRRAGASFRKRRQAPLIPGNLTLEQRGAVGFHRFGSGLDTGDEDRVLLPCEFVAVLLEFSCGLIAGECLQRGVELAQRREQSGGLGIDLGHRCRQGDGLLQLTDDSIEIHDAEMVPRIGSELRAELEHPLIVAAIIGELLLERVGPDEMVLSLRIGISLGERLSLGGRRRRSAGGRTGASRW